MIAYSGGHSELNPMAPVHWRSFIARHLTHY